MNQRRIETESIKVCLNIAKLVLIILASLRLGYIYIHNYKNHWMYKNQLNASIICFPYSSSTYQRITNQPQAA